MRMANTFASMSMNLQLHSQPHPLRSKEHNSGISWQRLPHETQHPQT